MGNVAPPSDAYFQDYIQELTAHIKSREELQERQEQLKLMEDQKEVALTAKEVLSLKVTNLEVCLEAS
jgi:hypothetical protein